MYLLLIREGLATRYVGPYESPKHAADDLDRLLADCDARARWQIHELHSPQFRGLRELAAGMAAE
ncbi:MAG: hypothetical protein EB070_03710 [Synechococcaceae bacterium WBA_2_066]|nr:hypothetical protein [Synechococcaceae bacterium WB6_1A_059]NBP33273.1 hypothetical protein [Synechococcaceae bacterium WB6_1B_055]NBR44347.1 hypothetical protein [Synechococcaceae bacterium WB5_2B_268]NBY60328.1 hypothetical protein [Synechococcaceae bacterium LLD_019]NCU76625.1 hypothetical protein [Synechococcaceae bacterium WB7_1C_051]NCU90799.1 hypothetical protein [Synechococcaceae bacterium WB7_1B_046]NCY14602.1 hypothetical protein [Synechococcaceae bacterium WB8_1A_041]NDC06598.1